MTTANLPPIIREMNTHFISKNDPLNILGNVTATGQMVRGVRGLWTMGAIGGSGQAIDQSGNGNHLTNNNNAPFSYDTNHLFPYVIFNGSTQYFSLADSTPIDIIGSEAYVASARRGLLMWAWIWFDVSGNAEHVMGKDGAAGQRSYFLAKTTTNFIGFFTSGDGTNIVSVTEATGVSISTWYFVAAQFIPSTELNIWVSNGTNNNLEKTTNSVGVPATLFNSTAAFDIGRRDNNTNYHDGRGWYYGLSTMRETDAMVNALFQQTRELVRI